MSIAIGRRTAGWMGLATLLASAGLAQAQVQWKATPGHPLDIPPSADVASVLAALAPPAAEQPGVPVRAVVQARGPLSDQDRLRLRAMGVHLLSPLGGHAHFATLDPDALDRAGLNVAALLTGAVAIEPDWKLDPRLAGDQLPDLYGPRPAEPDPVVPVTVVLFADERPDMAAMDIVARHADRVVSAVQTLPMIVAEVRLSKMRALAAEGIVQWVEPALPALTTTNDSNRALVQANTVNAAPYSLNGAGVTAFVFDGGSVRTTHRDFDGRVTLVDSTGTSGHATHVAATIGGTGVAGGGTHRGMAPAVRILSAGVEISGQTGWLYSNPVDIELDYSRAYDQGAHLSNNSIGTNVANNGFDCNWEGDYPATSAVIDAIARGDSAAVTDNNPFRICWAGGNERSSGRCGSQYRTIGPPASAKNPLIVGAVNSNDDSMTGFSGWGPTDDGRMKPDFVGPGCQSGGDGGVTSAGSGSDSAYSTLCGTSMSTPTTAGCVALMLQDFRQIYAGLPDPRNSTLKALICQSAVDRGNPGPDYQFGYGSLRVQNAIDLLRTGHFAERTIAPGDEHAYELTVEPGAASLVVTIAWDDVPGTPNVSPALVNNIDLRIIGPDETHYPWRLDPANPSAHAVRTGPNTLDNIEQVRIDNPVPGSYSVRVNGQGIQQGSQTYSIVASQSLNFQGGQPIVSIAPVQLAPAIQDPSTPTPVSVNVFVSSDTLVDGSVQLLYSATGAAPFTIVPMTSAGPTLWTATLPGFACNATPVYSFRAEGQAAGETRLPSNAPASLYSFTLDSFVTDSVDTMETGNGWFVATSPDPVTTGQWERADPQGTTQQPDNDVTADGTLCWVTGATAGASVGAFDVDAGETRLVSRAFDLAAMQQPQLQYWRWYHNGTSPAADDVLTVDISNDDGATWTRVETVGPLSGDRSGGWVQKTITVSQFVTPTSQVRLRFIASDYGVAHVVEAAIDDVAVRRFDCNPCPADFNGDGFLDFFDVDDFVTCFEGGACPTGQSADFNGDGFVDFFDFDAFAGAFEAGC